MTMGSNCGNPINDLPLFRQWPQWLSAPSSKIERRFARFHSLNPHVYAEFERRAIEAFTAGARRIGVKAIAERIRWDIHTRTLGDTYKVNNTFVALYARLLLFRRPELGALVEIRHRGPNLSTPRTQSQTTSDRIVA